MIELTGPLAHHFVNIEGRGRVVEDFGGQVPTSTIPCDGLLFTRLASGRIQSAPAGSVELAGDDEVAAGTVEHLNYTI